MADLIDRQAAIEAVLHHGEIENNYTDLYYDGYCDGVYDSADMLKDLPSVQPETAKRIVGKSKDGMTLWYQCDMCNEPVDVQDDFCRGCGRRLTDG